MRPLPLLLLALLIAPPAAAAPQLTVKGHTSLRLLGLHRDGEGTFLLGELQDRDLQTGVPHRAVEITYSEGGVTRTLRATTDAEGRFRVALPGRSNAFRVEARFAGDLTYASESYPAETLDVTKQALDLSLASEAELDASQPGHLLRLQAHAEGKPVAVTISLRTDRGRTLGQLQTGPRGEASLRVETPLLGEPGRLALFAHFAGDDRLNPATRRFELTLVTPVRVSLRSIDPAVETDDEIRLEGEVRDISSPLAGATLHLDAMGRQVASTVSDGTGRFAFTIDASDFPPGRVDLLARYVPAVSWRRAASSQAVDVMVLAPRPIPLRLYIAPAVLTCLVLVTLLALRRGPALRRWLQARRTAREEPAGLEEEAEPVRSGLRASRSSGGLRSLVRQAFDVWGVVWDPTDHRGAAGAALALLSDRGEACRVEADAAGRFRIQALAPGTHQVTVSLAGYVSERFTIQIPHRGQLHDVRVDLVQVRVRILEIYRRAALPLLPDRELWARWTPRELARHIGSRSGRRLPPLEDLTRLLERAYWAAPPADEELIARASALGTQL